MAGISFKMDFPTDAELNRMFDAIPKLEKFGVLDKAIRPAAKIVAKRAGQLAPPEKPRSEKEKNKRSISQRSEANWNIPLRSTIGLVVRKYQNRYGMAVIGPKWPQGNKAYFNTSPKGNKGHLWGYAGQSYPRRDGKVHIAAAAKPRAQIRDWIVQAFDETRPQQLASIKEELTKLTNQMMKD